MKHLLPAVQRTALRIPWAAVGGCAAALLLNSTSPVSSRCSAARGIIPGFFSLSLLKSKIIIYYQF